MVDKTRVDPINTAPIVKENGAASLFFATQWQKLINLAVAARDTAQQALDALAAIGVLNARNINTTGGLQGGGDLSADRTLSLTNTGVTPGSYTNTDLTVDAKGRITAAANGSGGGGANTTMATLGFHGNTTTSQAAAFVGNKFTPETNMTISRIDGLLTPVSGATYKAAIAQVNGSHVVQAITLGTAFTTTDVTRRVVPLAFSSPVTLTAGLLYLLLYGRTDGTDVNAVNFGAGNGGYDSIFPVPGLTDAAFFTLAKAAPAIGDTATRVASAFRYSQAIHFTIG